MEISEKGKESYLPGACIRTFVKQLTSSSRPKKDMREREGTSMAEQGPAPRQHKKQVRRRLHTRKPYQEKLLNMAEARREIVSALKIHRAAMQQAAGKHESGTEEVEPRKNRRMYASDSYAWSDYSDNGYVCNSPGFCSFAYSWPAPPIAPLPTFQENLDFVLPNQTLGLNLNLQDFITPASSIYSSSSPSTSSSPPPVAAAEETPAMGALTEAADLGERGPIEGIKNTGSIEMRAEDQKDEELVSSPFDEVMEFPAWLNAHESCLQDVNDSYNFQDPALPCMDIGEMDEDWFA